jgi:hypothetical protein
MAYKINQSYYLYLQSRLLYGIIFWGAAKENIKVFRIQKKK